MIVITFYPETNMHHSVERECHNVKLRINGSFIDVWFDQDGEHKWIGIDASDLRKILRKKKHGSWVTAVAQYDEKIE